MASRVENGEARGALPKPQTSQTPRPRRRSGFIGRRDLLVGEKAGRFVSEGAIVEGENAVGPVEGCVIVGRHEKGRIGVADEVGQEGQDVLSGFEIEVARGLVGKNQERVVHQGASDSHPLLLATGEPIRVTVPSIDKADVIENSVRTIP